MTIIVLIIIAFIYSSYHEEYKKARKGKKYE